MRFIPTRVHGVLDYLIGIVLVAAPWLFGLTREGMAMWVPIVLGAALILYSLVTDYEWGVVRRLPMTSHLRLDVVSGALLAISPWLFGFDWIVWVPHFVIGLVEVGAGLLTERVPSYERGARGAV